MGTVLITGINGQDAAYFANGSLRDGWRVRGQTRSAGLAADAPLREMGLDGEVEIIATPLRSLNDARRLLERSAPDVVVNLAAQSSVAASFEDILGTSEANAIMPIQLLEAIRLDHPDCRFVQASSGQVFGHSDTPCDEATPLNPITPYAATKAFAQQMVGHYRRHHSLHASTAILFAHESPYRSDQFVTRKITLSFARIQSGLQDVLELGALDTRRDWGFAGDYAAGLQLMTAATAADDYVLATGVAHSVREFVERAATFFGYQLRWEGEGVSELAIDAATGRVLVRVNPIFYRPADPEALVGDPAKAEAVLAWRRQMSFEEIIAAMCEADARRVSSAGRTRSIIR